MAFFAVTLTNKFEFKMWFIISGLIQNHILLLKAHLFLNRINFDDKDDNIQKSGSFKMRH